MDGQAMPPYLTSFNDKSMIAGPTGDEAVRLANAVIALTQEAHAHEKNR
jgi:hypothetical protein